MQSSLVSGSQNPHNVLVILSGDPHSFAWLVLYIGLRSKHGSVMRRPSFSAER
jgi:hypothetical protein